MKLSAAGSAGSAAGSAALVEAGFSSGTPGTPGRPASTRRTNRTPALRSQPARASPPALCAARLFRADARPSRRLEDTTLLGSVRAPSTAAPLETWRFRRGDAPRAERMGPTARAFGPFAANLAPSRSRRPPGGLSRSGWRRLTRPAAAPLGSGAAGRGLLALGPDLVRRAGESAERDVGRLDVTSRNGGRRAARGVISREHSPRRIESTQSVVGWGRRGAPPSLGHE